MPRQARERSRSGIYHLMLRGINRQNIFEEEEDRQRFIETLGYYKAISNYKLYGYCLMGNHIHLLMGETDESLSQAIKRISSSYVYWYNQKYNRSGHLFQERFKSEVVETDSYSLYNLTISLDISRYHSISIGQNQHLWLFITFLSNFYSAGVT